MMDFAKNNLVYWAWLSLAFGASSRRKWIVLEQFDNDVVACYRALRDGETDMLSDAERRNVRSVTLEKAQEKLAECADKDIFVYGYESEGYPSKLRNISNPPAVLFSTGSLDFLNNRAIIGVVGARDASEYSLKVTDSICRNLAQWGVVIVSGGAFGVDTQAHKSAIAGGGKTVAVMGGSVDSDYPKGTAKFKQYISENGAVISEHFLGHEPRGGDFVARNRILTGICDGVLITQASKISGALNSASHAVSQGKDVFCVPPCDVFSKRYAGVSSLLRDGAIPVFSHRDILMQYAAVRNQSKEFARDLSMVYETEENPDFADDLLVEKKKRESAKKAPRRKTKEQTVKLQEEQEMQPQEPVMPDTSELTELQKNIVKAIFDGTVQADELSAKLEVDISELFAELTELEMLGIVRSAAGNSYKLNR